MLDVEIEVIANFNKMKSFTEDRTLIIKAMKNSPLLEVWSVSVCLSVCVVCISMYLNSL